MNCRLPGSIAERYASLSGRNNVPVTAPVLASRLGLHCRNNLQERSLAWVPLAYRKQRDSVARRSSDNSGATVFERRRRVVGHHRRGSRHQGDSRHHGDSQQQHGDRKPVAHRPHFKNRAENSQSLRVRSQEDKFFVRQTFLMQKLQIYHVQLGGADDSSSAVISNDKTTGSAENKVGFHRERSAMLARLSAMHSSLDPTTVSLEQIRLSENTFREITELLSTMILLCTKIQSLILSSRTAGASKDEKGTHGTAPVFHLYCDLSEQLLFSMIDVQAGRSQLVQAVLAFAENAAANGKQKGLFGWFTSKLLPSSDDKDGESDKSEENIVGKAAPEPIMAHEDPACGPQLEHLKQVADVVQKTMREESMGQQRSSQSLRRAQRLVTLMEKMQNAERDVETVRAVMKTYATVGALESAKACEEIYNKHPDFQDELFGTLLQCYYLASRFSITLSDRTFAAKRAEELVHQKWGVNSDPEQYEERKFLHCTKALLCLNAPTKNSRVVPNICERADAIVDLCIGRERFEEVFRNKNLEGLWKIAPSNFTLPLLSALVHIYATSQNSPRVTLAQDLLKILLNDDDFKANKDIPLPDLGTCTSVINGIIAADNRKQLLSSGKKKGGFSDAAPPPTAASKANMEYGMEILDLMFARQSCWPDQIFFHSLFRLVQSARPDNAGMIAEEILSKMHIRQCFTRSDQPMVNAKTYSLAMRCWLTSAEAGDSFAAQRALAMLQRIEAQSIPLVLPIERLKSRKPTANTIYDTSIIPDLSMYHLVMKICCSSHGSDAEKEKAFDIAFAVYEKMKKRGMKVSSDTFALLFSCCANLLPKNSLRRDSVTKELLETARNHGNVNETVLNDLKEASAEIYETYKQQSSGGFLKNLT